MHLPNLKALRILTVLLVLSLTAVSIAGVFLPGTYERDSASMAAQGVGQDAVDLFLVVPLLLVSFLLAARGNRVGILLYAGTLFYVMYSFVIYCFGVFFNQWFLLYCLTLGLSLYAFILVTSALKVMKVEEIEYKLPVNAVHVIDLVFALPGLILGSVLLWRGKGMGYVIASVAIVFMVLLTLALVAMVLVLARRNISEDFSVAVGFGVLSLMSLVMGVLLFRKVKA